MTKINIRLVFLFQFLVAASANVCAAKEPVEITAQKLEYSETSNKIIAEKNVKISSGDINIYGETMETGIDASYVVAGGSVAIFESGYYVAGDNLEYSFTASTGYIYNARGLYSDWYFRSDKVYKDSNAFYLDKSKFTTCDLLKPHYYFLSSKAIIVPKKEVKMQKATAYIGNIPAFFFPRYSTQLKERRDVFEVFPGNNSYDGLFLKTKYSIPISQYSYSKTYLDFFSLQGVGFGEEINYNVPGNRDGTIYGYYIKEQRSTKERWTLMSSHRQKLNNLWTLQGNLNFSSGRDFNQYYFTESWNKVNINLKTNLALTRQSGNSTLRISAERVDNISTAPGAGYYTDNLIAPKIEFTQITSRAGKLPFYYTLNTSLLRDETFARGYGIWRAQSDAAITRDFNVIGRITTLTPRLGINESWQDRDESSSTANGYYLTRYYAISNLRQKLYRSTYIDFTHSIRVRSKFNKFEQDYDGHDYGFETNNVAASLYLAFTYSSYLRISNVYEMKNFRDTVTENRLRLTPLVIEFKTPVSKRIDTYTRFSKQELAGSPWSTKSLYTEGSYFLNPFANFALGVSYTDYPYENIQYKNSAAFSVSNKWRIKYSAIFDTTGGKFRDNTIDIYRDLHCWEMTVSYKKRSAAETGADIEEFFFNIGIKAIKTAKDSLYNKKLESQFYPWRR